MSLFEGLFEKKKGSATDVSPDPPLRFDHHLDWSSSEIQLMPFSRFLKPDMPIALCWRNGKVR
jgi:hypothetical protein